jgi:ribosomal protein L29
VKTNEIRQLTPADMKLRIDETRKQILELRLQKASKKLTNVASVRVARKTLARLLTIETEEGKKSGK